jgi:hypothetical protein
MDLLTFSLKKWDTDPEMRIEDAYKWLFHATRGGEHAVRDVEGPRRWLDREWATLEKPLPEEPLLVALRPDGKILRLNLRPYRAHHGSKDAVLQAFVESAHRFKEDTQDFVQTWHQLGDVLQRESQQALTVAEWQRLDRETAGQNYPAISHSPHYEKARRPAYRVLIHTEARSLMELSPAKSAKART